jgi:hypothetical protein
MILLLYLVYSQIWLILFFSGLSALQLPNWTKLEKKRKEKKRKKNG